MTTTQTVNLHQETFENAIAALLVALAQSPSRLPKEQTKKRRRNKHTQRATQ
jgi:hypothetical protein